MTQVLRRMMLLMTAFGVLAAGCADADTQTSGTDETTSVSDTVEVDVSGFAFREPDVTVEQGGTVTWTNNDQVAHPLLFDDGERHALAGGDTVTLTFADIGTFDYRCAVHQGMSGTVTVVEPGTAMSQDNRPNVPSGY